MARTSNIALVAALAASLVALPATGVAKGGGNDGDVLKRGSCSASSSIKMKLSPENGRTEVELEVDQNKKGVAWNWTLKRAGAKIGSGRSVTVAPSGSFEVRRVVSNGGPITGIATRNGERCTVTASL
jgi:hypothetical protein